MQFFVLKKSKERRKKENRTKIKNDEIFIKRQQLHETRNNY